MFRTTEAELAKDAVDALQHVFQDLGLAVEPTQGDGADLIVHVDDRVVSIEVTATSVPSPEWVDRLLAHDRPSSQTLVPVVVGDLIPAAVQDRLRRAGWGFLDRRGHLSLRAPGLLIDASVNPLERVPGSPAKPLAGRAALSWAAALLMSPDEPPSRRKVALEVGMSHSALVAAASRLRDASLVQADDRPLVPELFWAVADVWKTAPTALASLPQLGAASSYSDLETNLHDEGPGWAVTGTIGALAWGAPVVASSDYPPDFYVPSTTAVRRAVTRLGKAETFEGRACTVRLAPTPFACLRRFDRPDSPVGHWRFAHPLFVALDLAQDKARGTEILDAWEPPGFRRVW